MYRITFQLRTAVSFIERPTFDGVLAWCYMKDKYGLVEQKLTISPDALESFNDLPILKHPDGYFLASWMQYDESKTVEFTGSWKKRWAGKHDHLVNFGKKVGKARIDSGEFKSYDMPVVLHQIRKVWFYFASADVERVRVLVDKHLWGLGKKTAQGYGEIDSFKIEPVDYDPFFQAVLRPIPAKESDITSGALSLGVQMMGFRPPYWLPENQAFCLVASR